MSWTAAAYFDTTSGRGHSLQLRNVWTQTWKTDPSTDALRVFLFQRGRWEADDRSGYETLAKELRILTSCRCIELDRTTASRLTPYDLLTNSE